MNQYMTGELSTTRLGTRSDISIARIDFWGLTARWSHESKPSRSRQGLRNRRLMAFRDGQVQILVATDVAARGLDVPSVSHVFNFGLPMKAEDYTHRIGRTGRAGRDGTAVTMAELRDRRRPGAEIRIAGGRGRRPPGRQGRNEADRERGERARHQDGPYVRVR